MLSLLTLAAAIVASAPDQPRTYLASIVGVPLKAHESIESFEISTWGVEFKALCKIPLGWRIKAGSSATPDGVLAGEGSLGATFFNRGSPPELRNLALITLYRPVQRRGVGNGPDATFKGVALVSTEDGERKVTLTYRNVQLTPARHCP